jgi:hypothetical protein
MQRQAAVDRQLAQNPTENCGIFQTLEYYCSVVGVKICQLEKEERDNVYTYFLNEKAMEVQFFPK